MCWPWALNLSRRYEAILQRFLFGKKHRCWSLSDQGDNCKKVLQSGALSLASQSFIVELICSFGVDRLPNVGKIFRFGIFEVAHAKARSAITSDNPRTGGF